MAQVLDREPAVLDKEQRGRAADAASVLADYLKAHRNKPARITVGTSANAKTVTVPVEAFRLFVRLMRDLSRGRAVTIVPYNVEVTTQQAADYLNVSRPYVVHLLESRRIPFRKVGPRRRIRFEDLMRFKQGDDAQRIAIAAELTKEAEELGLYDD